MRSDFDEDEDPDFEPECGAHDDEPQRCGGTGMVAYWDGGAYAGEMCRGCVDCEGHDDSACETDHPVGPVAYQCAKCRVLVAREKK